MAGEIEHRKGWKTPYLYPWPQMAVGDECVISREGVPVEYTESLARHAVDAYIRHHCPEKKFCILIISETEVRVRRVR